MVICIDNIIHYDLWGQVYEYYEKILKPAHQTDYDDSILLDEAYKLVGRIRLGLPPKQPSPPHDMQYWHTCLSLVYTALSLSDSDDEKIKKCILQLRCGIREDMLSVCNRFIQSVQHRYPLPPVDIVTALDLTLEDVRTITYDFTPEKVRELLPRFEWYNQHLFCEYVTEQYMRSGASEAEIKAFCQIIYDGVRCPSAIWDDETSATTETVEEKENPVLSEKKKKEIIGKTFKEVNDCVRERLANAISLCASGSDYAVLESVLFDVGYIKKVNAHKAFLKAISALGILPEDTDFLNDLWNQIKQKHYEMTNNGQSDNDMRKYNQLKDCFEEKQNLN